MRGREGPQDFVVLSAGASAPFMKLSATCAIEEVMFSRFEINTIREAQ